jgi:hypothetical protein
MSTTSRVGLLNLQSGGMAIIFLREEINWSWCGWLAQILKEDGRRELEIVMGNEHIATKHFQNWVSS